MSFFLLTPAFRVTLFLTLFAATVAWMPAL